MSVKFNQVDRDEAVRLYRSGESTSKIAERFEVAGETIRKWLHKESVEIRSKSIRSKIYSCDESSFSRATNESAYYAGFLMADGNISESMPLIQAEISRDDEEILESMKDFMKYDGPLNYRDRLTKKGRISRFVAIRVSSLGVKRSLADVWGIYPKKSRTAMVPKSVFDCEFSTQFFRGLFDGDGCVHVRKNGRLYLNFCGTPSVVDSFRDFCWQRIRESGNLQKRTEYNHVVQFSHKAAESVGRLLYGAPGPRLRRKERVLYAQ
jgi:intein/homing endonuclease